MLQETNTHTYAAAHPARRIGAAVLKKPDPIFALIEAHKRAVKLHNEAIDRVSAVEEKFGVNSPETTCSNAPMKFLNTWEFRSVDQIEEFLSRQFLLGFAKMALSRKDEAQMRAMQGRLRRKLMRLWNAAQSKQKQLQEDCGYAAVERERDKALDKEMAALKTLCNTSPTTAESFQAWMEYLRQWVSTDGIETMYSNGATEHLWATIEKSAKRLATR